MAINKELYERYKQLKAEGKNVTLAELKAEMENPSTNGTSYQSSQPSVTPPSTSSYHGNYNPQPQFQQTELPKATELNYTENYTAQTSQNNYYSATNNTEHYTGNVTTAYTRQDTRENKYALIGYPLGHSLSECIHNAGFKSVGIDATYELLETSPEDLVDRIKYLKANNYSGFNVTIPLKLPMTMFLNDIDTTADIIGAVNTVVINADKTMKGYNTDVTGFKNAIPQDFKISGKVAGVLGTGGAARAAISALATENVKAINLYTRNIPNSIELLNFLRTKFPAIEFNCYQIETIRDLSKIEILVNCTPIGMQGYCADMTPVEEEQLITLPQGALVYDVIYNPKKTVFLKLAQKHGYQTVNGIDMLVRQGMESERIWTGRTPDFKDMKIAILENL